LIDEKKEELVKFDNIMAGRENKMFDLKLGIPNPGIKMKLPPDIIPPQMQLKCSL
jgi:hypothetical protein